MSYKDVLERVFKGDAAAYAAEIRRKAEAGIELSNPEAAAAFKEAHPEQMHQAVLASDAARQMAGEDMGAAIAAEIAIAQANPQRGAGFPGGNAAYIEDLKRRDRSIPGRPTAPSPTTGYKDVLERVFKGDAAAYAAEIRRKAEAGIELSNPEAAAAFKEAHPEQMHQAVLASDAARQMAGEDMGAAIAAEIAIAQANPQRGAGFPGGNAAYIEDLKRRDRSIPGRPTAPTTVGALPPASTLAPAPKVDVGLFNDMVQRWGLEPQTQEQLDATASAIVARQQLGKEQIVLEELRRFEESFPNEFEQAKTRINEQAATLAAEHQEDFAARGMFYSSIMANAITDIDEKALELIGEIALAAAEHVSALNAELRDIGQWAILEEEVVRRQLMAESRDERFRLSQLQFEVARHADQVAIDMWYKGNMMALEERGMQLQEMALKISEAERQGQHFASAMMAQNPIVQESMANKGISTDMFASLSLEQQSSLVTSILNYEAWEQEKNLMQTQATAMLAEIQRQRDRLALDERRVDIGEEQFAKELELEREQFNQTIELQWSALTRDHSAAMARVGLDREKFNLLKGDMQENLKALYEEDPVTAARFAEIANEQVQDLRPVIEAALLEPGNLALRQAAFDQIEISRRFVDSPLMSPESQAVFSDIYDRLEQSLTSAIQALEDAEAEKIQEEQRKTESNLEILNNLFQTQGMWGYMP